MAIKHINKKSKCIRHALHCLWCLRKIFYGAKLYQLIMAVFNSKRKINKTGSFLNNLSNKFNFKNYAKTLSINL